jgi:hypothetical protein
MYITDIWNSEQHRAKRHGALLSWLSVPIQVDIARPLLASCQVLCINPSVTMDI